MRFRFGVWLLIVALGMTLAGCGGGGDDVHSEVISVTTGQQLIDLKKARDMGAMTDEEYQREREKVLNRE